MSPTTAPDVEGHVTLNGQAFYDRRWGATDLPPLLMLHGFPEYGGAWAELAAALRHRFHCIAPDQRGYGQSWAPDEVAAYRTSELVRDMGALIDTLGADPFTVLGHDWGAAVAYGLAMGRPELVSRLIIANGVHPVPFQTALAAGGPQTAASQYIHTLRRDGSETWLAENGYARLRALFSAHMDLSWLSGAREEDYLTEWSRPGRLRSMIHWYRASPLRVPRPGERLSDLPAWPKAQLMVRCPHLLIWGEDDTALLPEATEALEDYAPDLTRVTLPGVDHWLCHQAPDRVAAEIERWCAAQAA